MNKWKLLTRALRREEKNTYETAVWMHASSDDDDSHDWVDGGWVNGTGLFGSGEWLDGGWTNGTGLFGNGEWLDGGWVNGTGPFGSGDWLDGGWTNGTGAFGSGDWLDGGWTNGTGLFGRAYGSHGSSGSDGSSDSDYSSDTGSSWGNDGWSNSGSYSGSGGGARYTPPPKKSRVRFPWISLFFTVTLLGSTGWVPDVPSVIFGIIFIINFIRWIKQ